MYWQEYSRYHGSIIDKYFRGVETSITTCQTCHNVSMPLEESMIFNLQLDTRDRSLTELLSFAGKVEDIPDYKCDKCEKRTLARQTRRFGRLPPILVVMLKRYANPSRKNKTRVNFDLDAQSFAPVFLSDEHRRLAPGGVRLPDDDDSFGQQLSYRCFGVVMHQGDALDSGHYFSYLRDVRGGGDEDAWYKYNDAKVQRLKHGLDVRDLFKKDAGNGTEPFLLFFSRRR